jgi:glycosyltransferase involved in cell wall biosynthesis
VLGHALRQQACFRQADLVHLQLLHARSFFSLLQLPGIANGERPVVWTLHDPWITSGHCVHSLGCERWKTGCGKCPDLQVSLAIDRDATAFNWRLKRQMLARAEIHLVVASHWMRERVLASPILSHMPVSVIPFGLDRSVFYPRDKAASRAELGIPPDARSLPCAGHHGPSSRVRIMRNRR